MSQYGQARIYWNWPKAKYKGTTGLPVGCSIVYLTKRAQKGQANKALIKLLAKQFKVAQSKIKIVHGEKSRSKLIEIV